MIGPSGIAIDGNDNVCVANNWDRPDEGLKEVPDEVLSTRFPGNVAVVFFGLAKPVCWSAFSFDGGVLEEPKDTLDAARAVPTGRAPGCPISGQSIG